MDGSLLRVAGLTKTFERQGWLAQIRRLPPPGLVRPALLDVTFELERGATLGVVGESGSGKSTLARCVSMLEQPDSGSVTFDGQVLTELGDAALRGARRRIQMVFQDPYASLNPRQTVGDSLSEVLTVHHLVPRARITARIEELLDLVGLPASAAPKLPRAFSGGQRQRICIARALAAQPDVLVADEPVSALDVSVQAQILNLLRDLQRELQLALLLISHNLFVVSYLTRDIAVMYGGRIVERITTGSLVDNALHPYTRALVEAIPRLHGQALSSDRPETLVASALPTEGCPYRDRCPHAFARCEVEDPPLVPAPTPRHLVACHYVADRFSPPQLEGSHA